MTTGPLITTRLLAEAFGTGCLVLFGTGAIIVNDASSGAITHVGVALAFGLVVMAMIEGVGDVSGAHINPAVTLGFVAAGRFPLRHAGPYIAAQSVGALVASAVLRACFPLAPSLGQTNPAASIQAAWVLEFVLTLVLMFVILRVATGPKEKGLRAGLTIGGVVALEALAFGPATGASMNPARSLGPALVTGDVSNLWIYLSAPTLGALAAVPLHRAIGRGEVGPPPGTPP